jgi:hypothetical protein
VLVTYKFPLNNVFLYKTNTFDCVTVDISFEICESSKVTVGWGSFEKNKGVIKMGSVIKIWAIYILRECRSVRFCTLRLSVPII